MRPNRITTIIHAIIINHIITIINIITAIINNAILAATIIFAINNIITTCQQPVAILAQAILAQAILAQAFGRSALGVAASDGGRWRDRSRAMRALGKGRDGDQRVEGRPVALQLSPPL